MSAPAEAKGMTSPQIEKVRESLARRIMEEVAVPTIGIGASAACDGQILVVDDMLCVLAGFRPKFVKRHVELGEEAGGAIAAYAAEARERRFPAAGHVFGDGSKAVDERSTA